MKVKIKQVPVEEYKRIEALINFNSMCKCQKQKIRVISGGQIGADIAALRAAKEMGLPTGGHMCKNFATLVGYKRGYGRIYGCIDDTDNFPDGRPDYKTRTWKNVQEADGTIRLATNFGSRGEICTLNAIRHYKKPSLDIYMEPSWQVSGNIEYRIPPREVATWVIVNNIKTLNVAGNANLSLEESIYSYLLRVFTFLSLERGNGIWL